MLKYNILLLLLVLSTLHLKAQQNAIQFDGLNDYLNLDILAPTMDVNRNQYSIEFWIKADTALQQTNLSTLLSISSATNQKKLNIVLGGPTTQEGKLMIYGNPIDNPTGELIWEGQDFIADNTCHHIAYTYDGVNHVGKIYIDGVLKSSHNLIINLEATDKYSFGQEYENQNTSNFYNGTLTDLRFWSYIKTDAELAQNMYTNYTGTENGFIALYQFMEGIPNGNNISITSLIDSSPNNLNGLYINFSMLGTLSNFITNPCVATDGSMNANFDTTENTNCTGQDCQYEGPSILINELMVSPNTGDGSISSVNSTDISLQRGEWIELYNPNLCEPVDIGCYYLGNYTNEGNGGFVIPPGTIVPPSGFCILRGLNATPVPAARLIQNGGNVVEIVFPAFITNEGICASGQRVWFPNAGGWFAFYDRDGVPQDAVAWGNGNLADRYGRPCVPTRSACTPITELLSFDEIPADRKFIATNVTAQNHMGQSIRRQTDGGIWNLYGVPTYADCNATCIPPNSSTCTGTATINVTGGTAPYTYQWNDSQAQMTQTAVGLCSGLYEVIVTDATNRSQLFEINISNYTPPVSVSIQPQICVNANAIQANISPIPTNEQFGELTGPGANGLTFNPDQAGLGNHELTYVFVDENGCGNQATTQINVLALPILSWDLQNSYCIPTSPHILTLTPSGGILTGPGTSGSTFNPTLAQAGTHTITYEYTDNNNCTNTINAPVIVYQTQPAIIDMPEFLCVNSPIHTPQGNFNNGTFSLFGTTITTIDPSALGAGTYPITYNAFDTNNCPTTTTEPIAIYNLPQLTISFQTPICTNSGLVPITVQPEGGNLQGDLLTDSFINPYLGQSGINYSLTYIYVDNNGCSNTQTTPFVLVTPQIPQLAYETDCFQNANITISNQLFTSINWQTDGTVTNNGDQFQINYPQPGQYNITLNTIDINGCSSTNSVIADIPLGLQLPDFQVPNVITANNDNVNDEIIMNQKFDECIDYEIIIVNRWGIQVFIATKNRRFKGLDMDGQKLPEGVYFYEVKSDDVDYKSEIYKPYRSGFITIVR